MYHQSSNTAIFLKTPGWKQGWFGGNPQDPLGHSHFLVPGECCHQTLCHDLGFGSLSTGTPGDCRMQSNRGFKGLQPWSFTARSLKSDRQPQMESFRGYVKLGGGSPWKMMGWKMILSSSGFPLGGFPVFRGRAVKLRRCTSGFPSKNVIRHPGGDEPASWR